jgi:hypothetical protein
LETTEVLFILGLIIFTSCSDNSKQIRELENKLEEVKSYKPGFGEFMSNVQIHHAKLWFAGKNQNWKLAEFEINEIKETFDDLKIYQSEREETKLIPMISVALDSVSSSIEQKDLKLFKNSFVLLTNTCNDCHLAAHFEFNKIKIPETPPFSNQVFKK